MNDERHGSSFIVLMFLSGTWHFLLSRAFMIKSIIGCGLILTVLCASVGCSSSEQNPDKVNQVDPFKPPQGPPLKNGQGVPNLPGLDKKGPGVPDRP
jgi:hypothetical protein